MKRVGTITMACALAVLLSAPPAHADEPAVVDDVAPLLWGTTTFELGLLTTALIIDGTDSCESWGCGVLALLGAGIAAAGAIIAAAVAAATDAPGDVPLVGHVAMWAGLDAHLFGAGIAGLADPDAADPPGALVAIDLAAAIGQGVYATVRRDRILRSHDHVAWGHVFTWVPMAATMLVAIVLGQLDADDDVVALVSGAAGVIATGIAIAGLETR